MNKTTTTSRWSSRTVGRLLVFNQITCGRFQFLSSTCSKEVMFALSRLVREKLRSKRPGNFCSSSEGCTFSYSYKETFNSFKIIFIVYMNDIRLSFSASPCLLTPCSMAFNCPFLICLDMFNKASVSFRTSWGFAFLNKQLGKPAAIDWRAIKSFPDTPSH